MAPTSKMTPAAPAASGALDEYSIPESVRHQRPSGMRHAVWDVIHALDTPVARGAKTFTTVCLLCSRATGWEDALCRIANTSNAMKHIKSRHKEWEREFMASDAATASSSSNTAEEGTDLASGGSAAASASAAGGGGGLEDAEELPDAAGRKRKVKEEPVETTKKAATDSTRLAGKVAVITGASGGIGAAIATHLALAGASVVLGARRMDALEEVRNAIAASVGTTDRVIIKATDVTKRDDVHALVAEAENIFGDVDILVNNAGVMPFELLRNVNQDSWDKIIDINCKGTLNGIAAVLPKMLARKGGHIVNISSDAGRRVFAGLGVYSASKMFVEGVSQALRLEHIGSGLRVTCIQPGNVATSLVTHGQSTSGGDTEAMKLYGQPSGFDVLQPKDIANAVVYAVTQPHYVAVNEILVEPRDEPI